MRCARDGNGVQGTHTTRAEPSGRDSPRLVVVVMRRLKPQKHKVHVGDARNWDQAPRSRVVMLVPPCWFDLSRLRATLAMSLSRSVGRYSGKLWTGYGGPQGLSTPTTVKATVNGATEGRGEDHGRSRIEAQGPRIQCKDCFLAAECRMQHDAATSLSCRPQDGCDAR